MSTSTRLANDAWESLLSAHAVLMKRFAAEDIWHEASMREYDVLYTLSKCDKPVRIGELHRHVLLSQPALSRLVDRLVERGLVERCADPADGRGIQLSLTETGRDVQRRIGRRHARDVARAVTTALAGDELQQLQALCQKLAAQPPPNQEPSTMHATGVTTETQGVPLARACEGRAPVVEGRSDQYD